MKIPIRVAIFVGTDTIDPVSGELTENPQDNMSAAILCEDCDPRKLAEYNDGDAVTILNLKVSVPNPIIEEYDVD